MFGTPTKSIMVVYPKGYYDVATSLKHSISMQEGLDSTLWTIEQYQQNLPTLSGKSHVIFLGSSRDCPVSKPFHDAAESVFYEDGGCYAIDGSKVLVYGLDDATMERFGATGPDKEYVLPDGTLAVFESRLKFDDVEEEAPLDSQPAEEGAAEENKGKKSRWGGIAAGALGGRQGGASALRAAKQAAVIAAEKAKDAWNASNQRVENTKKASISFLDKGLNQWLEME